MAAHIAETESHVARLSASVAAPIRPPRYLPLLGVALAAFAALYFVPHFSAVTPPQVAAPEPPKLPPMRFAGERTAAEALAMLPTDRDARLHDVLTELRRLYADVQAGWLSKEQVLSRLGEVDARLQESAMRSTDGEPASTCRRDVERALREKGKALREHPATADLGRALADADLEEASRESRSLAERTKAAPPTLDLTKEQSEALKKILEQAADAGGRKLDTLDRDLDEAARALSTEDLKKMAGSFEKMAEELARLAEELEKMKDLVRLDEELEEMRETVAGLTQDESGEWRLAPGGGAGPGAANFRMQGVDAPADDEKGAPGVGNASVGDGTGGEPTTLDSRRIRRKVSGQLGDGASLVQIVRGAASEGLAGEAYRDVVETAARLAEDAVHAEEIPLGYRLFIKRYFSELTRSTPREEDR
jgi:hypothetical protein